MPMSPYQYPQYGVPGFQPQTMQQMVGQGYSPAPSFHPQPAYITSNPWGANGYGGYGYGGCCGTGCN